MGSSEALLLWTDFRGGAIAQLALIRDLHRRMDHFLLDIRQLRSTIAYSSLQVLFVPDGTLLVLKRLRQF